MRERGPLDDLRVQAETLRDVDAGRGARNSDAQLIGRLQSGFIEPTAAFTTPGVLHRRPSATYGGWR